MTSANDLSVGEVVVTQEDADAAHAVVEQFCSDRIRIVADDVGEVHEILYQAFARHRIEATHQPAASVGEAAAMREACAAYHDRKAAKWRKEADRHTRRGSLHSPCQQRDRDRAKFHEESAAAIRALPASQASSPDGLLATPQRIDAWLDDKVLGPLRRNGAANFTDPQHQGQRGYDWDAGFVAAWNAIAAALAAHAKGEAK